MKMETAPAIDLDEAVFLGAHRILLRLNKTVHTVNTKECKNRINTL